MKKIISFILLASLVLTGCGSSTSTVQDLIDAGFVYINDDYDSGYVFDKTEEDEIGIAFFVSEDYPGELIVQYVTPHGAMNIGIPFALNSTDITTAVSSFDFSIWGAYDFIEGQEVEQFKQNFKIAQEDFKDAGYEEQFKISYNFVVKNFKQGNINELNMGINSFGNQSDQYIEQLEWY